MNVSNQSPTTTILERILPNLRFPHLFAVLAVLFLVDSFVPDPIPFVDELLLGVLTLIAGTWKKRRGESVQDATRQSPKDVTDRGSDE